MEEFARVLVVLGLVAVNAFFVVAEYSLVTARRGPLREAAEAGSGGAQAALRLMDDPVRVISTVQVAITAVGILTGAIGEPLVRELLGGELPAALGFLIAFVIVTYLTVVFGELIPKAFSLDGAERLARLIARPIEYVGRVLRPIVWAFDGTARAVLKLFGVTHVTAGRSVQSPQDLRSMVDEAEQTGVIPRAQEELLHRVFEFASREVADAMVPGYEVVWIEAETPAEEALEVVLESVHTRFPVGEGTLDHVIGIAHSREIVAATRAGETAKVRALTRPAFVVPETKDLGALLREMREAREQIAVVASEYGTTRGIITVEDILEEIVGEIEDEYRLPDARVERIDVRTVGVSGSITVDDFNEAQGTGLPQDGPRTMAGLVFDRLGRAAEPGDRVTIGEFELRVTATDSARITRLEVEHVGPEMEDHAPDP